VTITNYLTQPLRSILWPWIRGWVKRSFPTVHTLSTQHLATWLSSGKEPPVLLDVRTSEEFAVSHLPTARHTPDADAVEEIALALEQPIVAYCSVGYRSARLVAQLQNRGFTQVYNLEGSLFQWANEGRPLERDGQPATQVHPYNALWGLLLKPSVLGPR